MNLHLLAGVPLLVLIFSMFLPSPIPAGVWLRPRDDRRWRAARLATILLVVGLAVLILPFAAFAQTAAIARPADTVSLAPWVVFVKPYIDALVMGVISIAVAFITAQIYKYTGVKVQAVNVERLKASIQTDVSGLIASGAASLSKQSFHVGSPVVASLADRVAERLPDVVKAAGITPDRLREFALGEVGKAIALTNAPPAVATQAARP